MSTATIDEDGSDGAEMLIHVAVRIVEDDVGATVLVLRAGIAR